ncbi:hypothetical protein [Rhodopseudomonas palustris]|uniref:Uncharacterized protein n=1 Tax=Rhodopseudomonas palustris (strain ATCC BAA-98 / CGA009) TaxID=258594 RepID=A0AAF0BPS4_RHOPA|nr:hypothetical protein [Rhodopseudomonas palustris]WAB79540.1 hypothetical protein OR798_09665 [Rhodopseudomonas palustris]WCL92024.1 hypothetical protein TX73_009660 [Rhodopseudomonas palustris CGA009]WND53435.1 translin family protein [Rhodopseudomonas palustris]
MVRIAIDTADLLPVDVVLVSHIDDDHLHGILDLTGEQRSPAPGIRLAVTSLWHNGFDDLLSTKPDELASGFGTASILAGADINMFAGGALARQRRSRGARRARQRAAGPHPARRRCRSRLEAEPQVQGQADPDRS